MGDGMEEQSIADFFGHIGIPTVIRVLIPLGGGNTGTLTGKTHAFPIRFQGRGGIAGVLYREGKKRSPSRPSVYPQYGPR